MTGETQLSQQNLEAAAAPDRSLLRLRDVQAFELLDGNATRGETRGRIRRGRLFLQLLFER